MDETKRALEKEVTIDQVDYRLAAQPVDAGVEIRWFCEDCQKGGVYGPFNETEPVALEIGLEKLRLHQLVHHPAASDEAQTTASRFQFTLLAALFGTLLVAVEMGGYRAWGIPGAVGAFYGVLFALALIGRLGLHESWGLPLPKFGNGELVLLLFVCALFLLLTLLPVWP